MTRLRRRKFLAARRTHLANVHRLFLDPLGPGDVGALGDMWRRLMTALAPDATSWRPARRAASRVVPR
ncbi:MAG: hypothetical protein WAL63_13315 [Solirubrobacteraceae bacterium]